MILPCLLSQENLLIALQGAVGVKLDETPARLVFNTRCQIQPVLRDRETFVNDLKEWTQGDASEKTRYISDWYQTVYAPAQGR